MTLTSFSQLGSRGRIVVAFLAGILVTLLVVTIPVLLVRPSTPAAQQPVGPPPAVSSASPSIDPDAGDYEHDHDTAEEEKPQWEPVVLGFAENFTNTTGGARPWQARLTPFVATAVRDQLADVDVSKVPVGRYESYEVLTPGSYQLAIKISYREGWALVLYATSDGHDWKITNYDRWEQ